MNWPWKREIYDRYGDTNNLLMIRYYLFPKVFGLRLCLHKFLRSDFDRAYHDHPWNFVSIILKGHYIEHYPGSVCFSKGSVNYHCDLMARKDPGDIIHHKKEWRHWVELLGNKPCWTLILFYGKRRKWGFWQDDKFIPQEEFIHQ